MRDPLGLPFANLPDPASPSPTYVLTQREFRRILNVAGWTIDDVIANPIARRDVKNWFKLNRSMNRRLEVLELERQWNASR